MKGLVFNILEEAVTTTYGPDTWDAVLERAGSSGIYASVGSYDDAELFRIVGAVAEQVERPAEEIVRWFGQASIGMLFARFPFDREHTSAITFLRGLDELHQVEVTKLYPDAVVPRFEYAIDDAEVVTLRYRSPRGLCTYAEGMIEGTAGRFGQTVSIEHRECSHRGDECCTFVCTFEQAA